MLCTWACSPALDRRDDLAHVDAVLDDGVARRHVLAARSCGRSGCPGCATRLDHAVLVHHPAGQFGAGLHALDHDDRDGVVRVVQNEMNHDCLLVWEQAVYFCGQRALRCSARSAWPGPSARPARPGCRAARPSSARLAAAGASLRSRRAGRCSGCAASFRIALQFASSPGPGSMVAASASSGLIAPSASAARRALASASLSGATLRRAERAADVHRRAQARGCSCPSGTGAARSPVASVAKLTLPLP